jgi:hypothetical protein
MMKLAIRNLGSILTGGMLCQKIYKFIRTAATASSFTFLSNSEDHYILHTAVIYPVTHFSLGYGNTHL